jgi:hypothetical protein
MNWRYKIDVREAWKLAAERQLSAEWHYAIVVTDSLEEFKKDLIYGWHEYEVECVIVRANEVGRLERGAIFDVVEE